MLSSYDREKLVDRRQTETIRRAELMRILRAGARPPTSTQERRLRRSQCTLGQPVIKSWWRRAWLGVTGSLAR